MGYMKYKGYMGSVEYSDEDQCLYGKVQGMAKDCITYEGNDVASLRKDFEGAVDAYLMSCKERGIEPNKAYSGSLNIRISPETHTRIALMANSLGTTINGYIRQVLDRKVASFAL